MRVAFVETPLRFPVRTPLKKSFIARFYSYTTVSSFLNCYWTFYFQVVCFLFLQRPYFVVEIIFLYANVPLWCLGKNQVFVFHRPASQGPSICCVHFMCVFVANFSIYKKYFFFLYLLMNSKYVYTCL